VLTGMGLSYRLHPVFWLRFGFLMGLVRGDDTTVSWLFWKDVLYERFSSNIGLI
jgi:hypothetical protein